MNLLDLFVRVGVNDEASSEVEQLSGNMVGKLGSAAVTVGKALAGAFAVKKVYDFGKAAFDAYAEFEQLEGGVGKLFGDAAGTVMDNAQKAFSNMGLSANEYMSQVTSFSAALINDLGGDTAKAAELSDTAMKSMADNVSIFGSDVESVQNAYQGFAKQNYTMLDNLKLGYGGTKTEMERLISDANEYAASIGQASDLSIDSFADVVKAIDLVQQKQGVAGNAAAEASKTIEGSLNATKAAWQNLVLEFGKEDGDVGARINDLFSAVLGSNGEGGLLKNVTKRVRIIAKAIIDNVGNGIQEGIKFIADNAPKMLVKVIMGFTDAVSKWADDLKKNPISIADIFGSGDEDGIAAKLMTMLGNIEEIVREWSPNIMEAFGTIIATVGQTIVDNGPALLERLGEVGQTVLAWLGEAWQNIVNFLIENGPQILSTLADTSMQILAWLSEMLPQLVQSIGETLANIVNYIVEHREEILTAIGEAIQGIINAIVENGPTILQNVATAVGELLGYLVGAAGELLAGLLQSLKDHWPEIQDWFLNLPQTILNALGDLGSVLLDAGRSLISGFFKGLTEKFDEVKDWVGGVGEWIRNHKGPRQYDLGLLVDNGKWIMQGLQAGLEKGLPPVEDTLNDITDSIQAGINTNVGVKAIQAPSSDSKVIELLTDILNKDQSVYLDSGRLVGGIAPQMNYAMGRL